jgi:hypothetical protein
MRETERHERIVANEIVVERLIIREPKGGRVRAILDTGAPRPGLEKPDLPSARLTLLDGRGIARIVAEVDAEGHAKFYVGGPDQGPMVVVTPEALDLWSRGSVAAALRTEDGSGVLDLLVGKGSRHDRPRIARRRGTRRPQR